MANPQRFLYFVLLISFFSGTTIAQDKLFELLPPKQSGIRFSNDINETEGFNVMAYEYFYNGAGVAVGDLNNDGLEDIFFTANMKPNAIYINEGSMKFRDVTSSMIPAMKGRPGDWKTGVTMADVNNDGLLDIYVCYSGKTGPEKRRNELFINKGNLVFEEKANEYGLDDPGYSTQAAFFDFDRDGDLDMFLLNHSTERIDNLEFTKYRDKADPYAGSKLFENQNGHFVDVSKKAGIRQSILTFGLGVVVSDINMDGWPDLYVTNDYNEPDYLYINNHDGTFTDKAAEYLTHQSQFSMGADIADYNNDGYPDIFTLDMLPEDNKRQKLLQLQENYEIFELMQKQGLEKQYMRNMLHLNNGDGSFSEIGQFAGISNTDWSWSPLVADFDNDGYKDYFVTNGYLRDYTNKDFLKYWGDYKVKKAMEREPVLLMDLVRAMPSTKLSNYIFRNNKDLTFTDVKTEWGLDKSVISSGAAFADFDQDGDLDLVINNINEVAYLYENHSSEKTGNNYLNIFLKKQNGGPALGSKLFLYTGNQVQYEELSVSRGYLSCVTSCLHMGLGDITKVDSLKIIWPDGSVQVKKEVPVNTVINVEFNPSMVQADRKSTNNSPGQNNSPVIFKSIPEILNYTHKGFGENDFKRQSLMLFMYSSTGPVIAKADVNKDGLEDVFISGTKDHPGQIYLQSKEGTFSPINNLAIVDESKAAASAACFADFNGDGWPDLYVAKGGYSVWEPGTESLQDEIYINDQSGGFRLEQNRLPKVWSSSKSCVRACDFDKDGDIDLFVGGRVIPGQYPLAPESFLLVNDGTGHFIKMDVPFKFTGMVTDARWADVNDDGREDLVLVGEMMPIKVFINTPSGFSDESEKYFDTALSGFWFSLLVDDVDGDGKKDIVAGNLGLNSQIKFSKEKPATLYYADFDGNGSIDPFFNFYIQDKSYPYVSRDELNDQMYSMRRKFSTFEQYSSATMESILSKEDLQKAKTLVANEPETKLFLFKNGKFIEKALPVQVQFSAVTNIISDDFNGDGNKDLLLMGNLTQTRLKLGAIESNYGCLLRGDGKGNFIYVAQSKSGLCVKGDVKSVVACEIKNKKTLLIGIVNEKLNCYVY